MGIGKHKLYHELAWIYDKYYEKKIDYRREFYEPIAPYFEENDVSKVLDVACGSGHFLEILEKHGYDCTGIDLSNEMLKLARHRVTGQLLQQDMRKIDFIQEFDAITCLGSSFTYMQTHDDVVNALRGFYRCLKKKGILIFDCFDAENFHIDHLNRWREESQLVDGTNITCKMMNTNWNQEDSSWVTHWIWVVDNGVGKAYEYSDFSTLKAYKYDYLATALVENGFLGIKRIKSKRLAILAQKN